MLDIKTLEEQQNERATTALLLFHKMCADLNLNDTTIAQLLGVSRQTMLNYRSGTIPCRGVTARIRMVAPAIKTAKQQGLLPAPSSRKQGELVKAILSSIE